MVKTIEMVQNNGYLLHGFVGLLMSCCSSRQFNPLIIVLTQNVEDVIKLASQSSLCVSAR
jgi:hypothetical protein